MPWCAAKGCKNSTNKGVKMNYFPRDSEKRQKWVFNCATLGGMINWSPSYHSALCEYHFTADMWEKVRIDGKKKLKYKAIPTIFGELVYQVEEKIDKEPTTSIASKGEVIILHMDPITKEVQLQSTIKNREKCAIKAKINRGLLSQARSTNIKQNDESPEEYSDDELMQKKRGIHELKEKFLVIDENSDLHKKYELLEKMYKKSEELRSVMKNKHKIKVTALKKLVKKLQSSIC